MDNLNISFSCNEEIRDHLPNEWLLFIRGKDKSVAFAIDANGVIYAKIGGDILKKIETEKELSIAFSLVLMSHLGIDNQDANTDKIINRLLKLYRDNRIDLLS